jgi:hypothetical protein
MLKKLFIGIMLAAAKLGVSFPEFIGELRYVCTFPFGDGSAYHVIARTAFGKATLTLAAAAYPFLASLAPSERARAQGGPAEADLAPIAPGALATD